MQLLARSMVSGGPGVRRIPRWHPYHQPPVATPASGSSTSSESHTNHAPLFLSKRCTVSSAVYAPSPLSLLASQSDTPVLTDAEHLADVPKQPSKILTAEDRATYARCLIDRAVNILTQRWMPVAFCSFPQVLSLPKDTKGSTVSSSAPCSSGPSVSSDASAPRYPYQSTAEHMPLRQFMHEVLRRSRTSCTSLQTALCYVEAVASKLQDLVQEEMRRIDQQNVSSLIDDDATAEAAGPPTDPDAPEANCDADAQLSLPSPLLCPRRTFLASLLLASKFLQDRSYSNKAWGKLTGLAPREVGRCERALSEALEWRLWVGKGQESPFPSDYMDDGGPVVPPDAVYMPEPETSQPSALGSPDSPAGLLGLTASPSLTPARLRRTRTEAAVGLTRAACRRLGPAATWAPSRFVSAVRGSTSTLGSSARTEMWVHGLPSSLPTLPSDTPRSPIASPAPRPVSNAATLVDAASTPLSTPGSAYTQSSIASFASFSDLLTPADAFAHADVALVGDDPPVQNDKSDVSVFTGAAADPQLQNIVGAGDWTF